MHKVKLGKRIFNTVEASCSCCGASPSDKSDFEWFVYKAGLVDVDGIYFSYLCGDKDGNGCLSDIYKDQFKDSNLNSIMNRRQEVADTMKEIMPDDEDGVWSMMQDIEDGLFDY